jgi:hypothetical protein
MTDAFNDKYVIACLAEGLPNSFDNDMQQQPSPRISTGGRSSLLKKDDESHLLEIKVTSDLRHFFNQLEIDVGEPISQIRQCRQVNDTQKRQKSYLQLYALVFAAFYLDHS